MFEEIAKNILLDLSIYYSITKCYSENKKKHKQQKKFYSALIKNNDVVFDIGANIGQRSYVFSELCSKVIAVEPQPFCIRHLKSRFRFNKKIIIEPFAIDAKEGTAILHLSDSHTISSMSEKFILTVKKSVFRNNKWEKDIEVKTVTLDSLIEKHGLPAFIKIDVEGYELQVLKGLSKPVRGISFEFLPMLTEEIIACARKIHEIDSNYRFNYSVGEKLCFVLSSAVSYSDFIQSVIPKFISEKSFGDIYAFIE